MGRDREAVIHNSYFICPSRNLAHIEVPGERLLDISRAEGMNTQRPGLERRVCLLCVIP
jgi:hypothetical protein